MLQLVWGAHRVQPRSLVLPCGPVVVGGGERREEESGNSGVGRAQAESPRPVVGMPLSQAWLVTAGVLLLEVTQLHAPCQESTAYYGLK